MSVKRTTPARLGRRIKTLRLKAGLSQEDLAEPDYTAAYISHLEHGKRRPSQEALAHIGSRLGVTVDQILSGRDPDEDLQLEITTQRAVADIHGGQAQRALASLEKVRAAADKADHRRAVEEAEAAIALALYKLGRTEDASASCDRVLTMLRDAPPQRRASTVVRKARCLLQSDEPRQAVHLLEGHLAELRREDPTDPGSLVEVYAALIPGYFETGLLNLAADAASRGWELAKATEGLEQRACLYVNRAQLMLTQGHRREALAALSLAEEVYRNLGWRAEVVKVALAKSFALVDRGDLKKAEALIRDALDGDGSELLDRVRGLTRLAFIRRRLGDAAGGLEFAEKAARLAASKFKTSQAEAEREAALCLLDLGNEQSARDLLRKAQAKFLKAKDHAEAATTSRLLGDLMVRLGERDEAIEVYRQGLSAMSELNV